MDLIDVRKIKWGSEITLPSSRELSRTPHLIGARYPCRSVAYVPRIILQSFGDSVQHVLDPFMGSGTTAIEACASRKRVFGLEVDPFARLIANVATKPYSRLEIERMPELIEDVLSAARRNRPKKAYRPSLKNIEYWFDKKNYDALWRLRTAIETVSDEQNRGLLLTILADIVRACSKAERQSLKPYISTKYTKVPKAVFPEYSRTASRYIAAIINNASNRCSGIEWVAGDATKFSLRPKIHLAITSPPYINAMDYTRCIKLETAWIGTGDDQILREVKRIQVGEANRRNRVVVGEKVRRICDKTFGDLEQVDSQRYRTAIAYFADMERNLACVARSLRSGGSYFLIIGNSKIRGTDIPTHEIVGRMARNVGFEWDGYWFYRIKDHRTSIPRGNRGGKIEFEHVISLTKQ